MITDGSCDKAPPPENDQHYLFIFPFLNIIVLSKVLLELFSALTICAIGYNDQSIYLVKSLMSIIIKADLCVNYLYAFS